MKNMQRSLYAVVLSIGMINSANAMDPEFKLPKEQQHELRNKAREVGLHAWETTKQSFNAMMKQAFEMVKSVAKDAPEESSQDVVVETRSVSETNAPVETNAPESEAPVIETDSSKLLAYGIGAVVAVTVCSVTCILYKDGTLKALVSDMKQHPIKAVYAAGFVALTIACAYKTAASFQLI